MSGNCSKIKQKNINNFRKTEIMSAIIGLTGSILCLIPTSVQANECGSAPVGGGTINCTASGSNYNTGITYSGLTGDYNINFDSMTLNKVAAGPSNGVFIQGTGNQTYNILGNVDMTIDGRGPTVGINGMVLEAQGAGNTLTFNANDSSTNFNLKVLGAGPDSAPGLSGIILKADKVVADLSKATIDMEGGNINAVSVLTGGTAVNSINLVTGNITIKSHSTNPPDYDAAVELEALEDIKVNTTAGTIKVTGSSLLGPSTGLIGVRAITRSNTNGIEISLGNIDIDTDKSVGVVAYRNSAVGAGDINADTAAGTEILASGVNSIGIELNNVSGTTNLIALGSVLAKGENGTAIRSLSQQGGPVTIDVGADSIIEGGWSTDPLVNGGVYNPRNVNDLESKAAVGILLGAEGNTATVNNYGAIGAGTDRAIESLETAAGLTSTTTVINNSGEITGTMTFGSGDDVLNNTGSYNLRGFADTDGDGIRDHFRVAVTDFGTGTANKINNSGVLTLLGDNGQATVLDNTGEYVTGYVANTMAIGGATQGQILNVQTFEHSGSIDLSTGNAVAGDVLVISGGATAGTSAGGSFVSNGGSLIMDTVLNEGGVNSTSDLLVIDTAALGTGGTSISIINAGGTGAQTVGDGIELVRVLDSTQSAAGAFKLGQRVVAGAIEYDLFQHGVGGNAANGSWYLRSLSAPAPETGIYLNNLIAGSTMFMHTLHDRLGEPQYTDSYKNKANDENIFSGWVRVVGSTENSEQSNGTVKVDTDTTLVHFGGDLARWTDSNNNFWLFGLMGAYGHSKSDASGTPLYTQSGLKRTATGKIDGYSIGAYATWYDNKDKPTGLYVDTWMQYGWYDNKVQGNTLKEESFDSKGWTASIEAGYAFIAHDKEERQWMIEPKVQIAYNAYDIDDHDYNGVRVHDADSDGIITRLGARVYNRSKLDGDAIQPFVEVNWWHSSADNSLRFGETVLDNGTPKNRYELKAGLQGNISDNWQLWGHIGAQLGENSYERYEGMVGARYRF